MSRGGLRNGLPVRIRGVQRRDADTLDIELEQGGIVMTAQIGRDSFGHGVVFTPEAFDDLERQLRERGP